MTITVKKVIGDLYICSATPPDVAEAWSTTEPISEQQLYKELTIRGAHQVDVADAISDQEPLSKRLSAERYPKLREVALRVRIPSLADDYVQLVLMDWNTGNRTTTLLATADGTASMYFSNGGGFIGGSQRFPAIRDAALDAVRLAEALLSHFKPTSAIEMPTGDEVFFYINTKAGVLLASTTEERLRVGTDPLYELGAAMQEIITEYRSNFPKGA